MTVPLDMWLCVGILEAQCHFFPGNTDVKLLPMYIFNYYFPLTEDRKKGSSEFNDSVFIYFSGTGALLQGSKYIPRVHSHISNSSPIIHILKKYIYFLYFLYPLWLAVFAALPLKVQAS